MGVRGARTSETSTTQSWLARCSGGMYDSTHSLTCLIAALRKREAEGRLVSRVSVGRIAVRGGEDLRKLDARVPEARRAEGSGPEPLTLFFFSASASALLGSLKGPAMISHGRCFTRARENGRGSRRRRRLEKNHDHSWKNRHLWYCSTTLSPRRDTSLFLSHQPPKQHHPFPEPSALMHLFASSGAKISRPSSSCT